MSDVKRYTVQGRDWQPKEDESGTFVLAVEYDALLASRDQAWKAANSECQDWAREYEKRRAAEAERDQLRAQVEEQLPRLIDENHQLREERDSQQRVCIAEMETSRQLRAELDAIRGQEPVGHQFQTRDGEWRGFTDHRHYVATVDDGTWPIRAIYALQPQQPDAVSVPGVNEFAVEILRGALEGGSFDGGDIQEMGVKYGLLFPEQRTEPCCESGCNCAEFGFPAECFRIARALLSTRQAEEGE